jgi:TRAP transporter 4TM/12TM fusion protein
MLTKLVTFLAIAWCTFQLLLPQFLILESGISRSVHLGFALVLTFLTTSFSFQKKAGDVINNLKKEKNIRGKIFLFMCRYEKPWKYFLLGLTILFFLILLFVVFYRPFFNEKILNRLGDPNFLDISVGFFLICVILEAVRRKVGMVLSVIVILFTGYAFFASFMPDFMAFKSASLEKYITQIVISDEGIFGIPLGVSTATVFLFVLFGALLNSAGAGEFFTKLALALFGRFRGGPAKAAVFSSTLLGSFSGSSIANVVTSGNFTIPLMKKTGYPAKKAAAIEVAASTDGQIMPPIMGAAAFIIAEYINAPYFEVAIAALIPAVASSVALFAITHWESCKLNLKPLPEKNIPRFRKTLREGFPYLFVLFILLYELFYLRHTPEFSAYIAILVFIVVLFCQQYFRVSRLSITSEGSKLIMTLQYTWKILEKGCVQGAKNMIPVALATAASGIIVGIVTMGLGGILVQIVEFLSHGNFYLLLLITAVVCLILGIGLPTTATYIVMASLTAPIMVDLGMVYGVFVPLIAAHLFCFYFGILADDTPPVGLAAYAASAIAKSDPIKTGLQSFFYDIRTAILPFFFVLNVDLLLYDIENFWTGLLIFCMAVVGILMFESAVQNWFLIKNKWYEIPFFLLTACICLYPGLFVGIVGISQENRHFLYVVGIWMVGMMIWWQKWRCKEEKILKK